jgi:hypothetical protein
MPIAFNLVEAEPFRSRGVKARNKILGALKRRPRDDAWGPSMGSRVVIDCVFDLQTTVLCASLAVESLANHAIETLPAGTTITRRKTTYDKGAMVRWLSLDEKYKKALPMVAGGRSIAGTRTWDRYLALKDLRDELVHIKERGLRTDADEPSAYDRLILGEADSCVDDAIAVVEGAWPGFLPEHVRSALGLSVPA